MIRSTSRLTIALGISLTVALPVMADSFSTLQWGLHNNGSAQNIELDHINVFKVQGRAGQDIQIPLWLEKPAKKIIVAVLDTGADKEHPDLIGVLHRNESECRALEKFNQCLEDKDRTACEKIWMDLKNPEVDQDKNGYPLDCSGWSILGATNAADIMGRPDFTDEQGHGTHVSGIIAADRSNGSGVEGVSSNVEICGLRLISE